MQRIAELSEREQTLADEEKRIRSELKDARLGAEKDTQNLNHLEEFFIDCLLRAKIPGFFANDIVKIRAPHFLPEVTSADGGDLAVTSFTNLGSGGKKNVIQVLLCCSCAPPSCRDRRNATNTSDN